MRAREGVRGDPAPRPDLYLWNKKKRSKRVHIAGTNGKSLCQIENSRTRLNGRGKQIPVDRKICENCKSLWAAGVRIASPHRLKRRPAVGLSSATSPRKTGFNTAPVPEITKLSPRSTKGKSEPRLSVLLGEAIDDSPPWDDDDDQRPAADFFQPQIIPQRSDRP